MKGCSFPFLSFFLYVSVLYLLMGLIFFFLFHVSPFSCAQEQWQARGRVGVVLLGVTGVNTQAIQQVVTQPRDMQTMPCCVNKL
jgi:hypothetical protein